MFVILIAIIVGYLLGSVPFGLLAGRMKGVDVREHGSRNIGATNVWRVCGWRWGLPVFVLDVLKGVLAVYLARYGFPHAPPGPAPSLLAWAEVSAAMACVLGHSFPAWLGFKGGKGVATALGALLAIMWLPGVITFGIWAVIFGASRYVSLASILAAAAFPIIALVCGVRGPQLGFAIVVATLVVVRHRGNMQRLLAGTESRFARKKEAAQ